MTELAYEIREDELTDLPESPAVIESDIAIIRNDAEVKEKKKSSRLEAIKNKVLIMSLGAFVVSSVASVVVNPIGETIAKMEHAAPWVVPGFGATEGLFMSGIALMGIATGIKLGKNPLKIKERFSEIVEKAPDSKMFKTGLGINTIGALGSAGIIIAGTASALPESAWPAAFWFAGLDITATAAIRMGILRGIRNRLKQATEEEAGEIEDFIESQRGETPDQLTASESETLVPVESNNGNGHKSGFSIEKLGSTTILGAQVRAASAEVDAFYPIRITEQPTESAILTDTLMFAQPETAKDTVEKLSLKTRAATLEDIPALVDLDMKAFRAVYQGYGIPEEELRTQLQDKFEGRFRKIGGDWMRILESNDQIQGFITNCPTNKTPEEFKSWEDTTDNGTLETTYDPNGKNVYIVSLSLLTQKADSDGKKMLIGDQIGKFISEGYEKAFFESRLPGLRSWVKKQCKAQGTDILSLDDEQKLAFADEYFHMTREVNGEEVPYDPLIRIYKEFGCKFIKVVPNAYKDELSMNFGVVCVFDNPMPKPFRKNRLIRSVVGKAVRGISRSEYLVEKLF